MSDSNADTTDAQPTTTAFDARRRLRGDYDDTLYFQFRRARVAQDFSPAAGGEVQ
jgi:Asp-tRNA(Asn)/Glu-tRNA(Gln) amidotransferase C subunit